LTKIILIKRVQSIGPPREVYHREMALSSGIIFVKKVIY